MSAGSRSRLSSTRPRSTAPRQQASQTVEEWLADNPSDSDAADVRALHEAYKRNYLRHQRDYLGWAIFAGWKRP